MAVYHITRFLSLVVLYFELCHGLEIRSPNNLKHQKMCLEQAKDAYFDIEQVIGKPWRIYYTWNVQMEDKCLDMTIKNATTMIANRIYNDMHEYLQTQPVWDAATIYVTMGTAKHELLLFADQGAAGNFLGVPNVIRDGNITPSLKAVPLLKFFLKLLHGGKYLLMMDCHIGVASLLSRERPPYKMEVASVAQSLNIGDGTHACISDSRKDEHFALQ